MQDLLESIGTSNLTLKSLPLFLRDNTIEPPVIPDYKIVNIDGTCFVFTDSGEFERISQRELIIYNENYINDFLRNLDYSFDSILFGDNKLYVLGESNAINNFVTRIQEQTTYDVWDNFLEVYFGDNPGYLYLNAYPTDSKLPLSVIENFQIVDSSDMFRYSASVFSIVDCSDCETHVWINLELLYNRANLYELTLEQRLTELLIGEKTNFVAHNEIAKTNRSTLDLPSNFETISSLMGLAYYVDPSITDLYFPNTNYNRIITDISRFATSHLKKSVQ